MSSHYSNGSIGSEISADPFAIDIDEALREFAAPVSSATAPAGYPAGDRDGMDTYEPPLSPLGRKESDHEDVELPSDEALSSEPSDPDVIHIDLTQRHPPLPMSGLALEQLVSLLPGNTYAVAGSGMPMRMSPRAEPRQQSPSRKAASPSHSMEMGSVSADCGPEAAQYADINADGEQKSGSRSNGGHAASGSPRSPQVALTFVPGLGLVPIVLNASDEEEEEEEEEQGEDDSSSDPFGVEGDHPEGGVAGTLFELGAPNEKIGSGAAEEVQGTSILDLTRTTSATGPADGERLTDEAAATNDESVYLGGEVARAADSTPNAGPQLYKPSSDAAPDEFTAGLGISKDRFSDVIHHAMPGLVIRGMSAEDTEAHDDLELESTGVDFDSSERHAARDTMHGLGVQSATAGDAADEEQSQSSKHQLRVQVDEGAPALTEASEGLPLICDQPTGSAADDQESDEYDDDLINDEGDASLDEVDDSGSGGGDEPESILGGLGNARRGFASETVFLGKASAPVGQHTSTTVEASGVQTSWGVVEPSLASSANGLRDPRPKGHLADGSGVAGLQLPRPRYVAHKATRSYDASYCTKGEDSPPRGGDRRVTADGLGAAESSKIPVAPAAPAYQRRASEARDDVSSDDRDTNPISVKSGSSGSSSSNTGSDLNSTFRGTGQSLAAVRQAALHAEAQRQAKRMAERLGGGGDRAAHRYESNPGSNLPEYSAGRPGSASICNPFGCAQQEASAAAGLSELGSRHRAARRGSSTSTSSTGYMHNHDRHQHSATTADDGKTGGDWDVDLEDLLRDRPIIQPRYPTDVKGHQGEHTAAGETGCEDVHDLSLTMEADSSNNWRPRHRRSVDVVDLDMLAKGEADEDGHFREKSAGSRTRSADGNAPPSVPSARSLIATRKSDDGQQLAPPLASSSPRLGSGDSGSESSSSAQSVADERLVDEMEALREELGQKTTLVAGLRGELRKYTDLAMRLEHQLNDLRAHGGDASSAATAKPRYCRSQSDAGALGNTTGVAPNKGLGPSEQHMQQRDVAVALGVGSLAAPASVSQPSEVTAPAGMIPDGGMPHMLPPHPQAQGLEGAARLALFRDILSHVQLQVGRSGSPAPPDLRDAHELLKGKEILDAGTEKVMLIKLQKMITWGCEAAWKASVAQQQAKFMEHTAQQTAQERSAWEAEREQLRQALEEARALNTQVTQSAARTVDGRGLDKANTEDVQGDIRRQLRAAQDEAAKAKDQVADLESAVASLNADVRRLRSQLRNSRDGVQQETDGSDPARENVSRADSTAWAMERKLLLTTITALNQDLEQARAGCTVDSVAVEHGRSRAATEASATSPRSEPDAKKLTLVDAALEQAQKLPAESDTALQEPVSLRRRLEDMLASGAVSRDADRGAVATAGRCVRDMHHLQMDQLQQELSAAQDALEKRTVDAEAAVALHEQQSAALRAQVVELRQELALTAADLAAAAGWREDDQRALAAEQAAVANKDSLIQEQQTLLLAIEVERNELKAVEQLSTAAGDQLGLDQEAILPVIDIEEALRVKSNECERLQRLVDAGTCELAHVEAQLEETRTVISAMRAEAAREQPQVAKLQVLLETMQQAREVAEVELARAIVETEVLKSKVSDLENQVEKVSVDASWWRGRAEQAESAAAEAREKISELRAYAAGLQAEARDLRTALSAEDNVQAQLRGQVECLENELEAQASLAQRRGEEAAKMEAALAESEHHRHDISMEDASMATAVSAELEAAQGEAIEARERVQELETSLAELRVQLAEAVHRGDAPRTSQEADDMERGHPEAGRRYARTVGLEPGPHSTKTLRQEQLNQESNARQRSYHSEPTLWDRLRAADLGRDVLREELSELRRQLHDGTVTALQCTHEPMPRVSEQAAAFRAERARLQADCTALQTEMDQFRSGQDGGRIAEAQIEALRSQLQTARSELQAARADLHAANVELSVKSELMAAKDRSLVTLQETVDALKLALQVTHQNLQPAASLSGRTSAEPLAGDGGGSTDGDLDRYRGTVAALQIKFADSESTIRRLEKQVAALETKLSADGGPSPTPTAIHALSSSRRRSSQLQPQQLPANDTPFADKQLKEKDEENARLLQEVESTRGSAPVAAADLGHAVGSSPLHGLPGGSAEAVSTMTINSLQMQLEQWRNVSEDLHARYQAKKEAVRRLRDQLSREQKRRADEQVQGQVQLEAASQRLVRLATDLGTVLRRCIALDLQSISATTLTTSPRTIPSGGALPDDINAITALLARQGAALVESLEVALDQLNTAREERTLLTAQLANKQALLDELRYNMANRGMSTPGKTEAVAGAVSSGTSMAGSKNSQASPLPLGVSFTSRPTDIRQATPAAAATFGGLAETDSGFIPPVAGLVAPLAADASLTPTSMGSRISGNLHSATVNLAQDMATLSAQQAGLRSTLQGFEQRLAQQAVRARSMNAATYPSGATTAYPLSTTSSYPAVSPLRSRTNSIPTDGFTSMTAAVPTGSPPHAYVGILSSSRAEPRTPLGPGNAGGSLHNGSRKTLSPCGQLLLPNVGHSMPSPEGSRVSEVLGRDVASVAGFRSPIRPQFLSSPRAARAGTNDASPGALGWSASAGSTSPLMLSRERHLKLADGGL
ncbi:hypothetical protein Vretimale_14097 [Volvox reticuliferus]|uniref:Uncharacterized protein n=1 Tax=Volvox reticuliferus TaxID=1737510 RepID=A0A8J4LTK5_9CHLO|nr:hypothetical protein Vretifemale_16257 [Volvox reticuliferus]GIM10331.1 hypothetical protein Vretimale_14097 [Volvox reticuliferus]